MKQPPPRPARADASTPPQPGRAGAFGSSTPRTADESKTHKKNTSSSGDMPVSSFRAPLTSHIAQAGVSGNELFVTFKDERNGGETRPYIYTFDSPEEAEEVYKEMHSSPHPYGQVLLPDVIDAGIEAT